MGVSDGGISPHHITQHINHMSNIHINMVNFNKYILSSLDTQYTGCFYYVFPLHLNSFNRLFSEVINPKLANLKSFINSYIKSTPSYVLNYAIPLYYLISDLFKIDFDSLLNLLPTESIIHPFIASLKKNLDSTVSKLDLTTTTDIINLILLCIISEFHQNFQRISNEISNKLNPHINQIDDKIKSIPNETKRSINIILSEIDNLKVDQHISYLEQNIGSLSQFNKYNSKEQLMKVSQPNSENGFQRGFSQKDIDQLGPVYLRLKRYKIHLESYNSIKNNLNELKDKLTLIKNRINETCNLIKTGDIKSLEISKISLQIYLLQYSKIFYIKKLKNLIPYFYTLQKIGGHISSLKGFCSSELKGKLDDGFCKAVNSLSDIEIIPRQIEGYIYNIRLQTNYIISELKLIKSLLQYRDSLKIILMYAERLPCYIKNNVHDFLENSKGIVQTLKEASKTIETTTQAIEELKTSNSHLQRFIPDDSESEFKNCIQQIPEIIKEVSVYLRIVRYIVYYLQIVKCNSTKTIKEIKDKINLISDLSSALTKLKEIYSDLIKFYYTHVKTTFFLNFYSGLIASNMEFEKQLNKINLIIYETGIFIYLITVYYIFLYHINVIVTNMKKLEPKISDLNKLNPNIGNIRSLIDIIINRLGILNRNISKLELNLSEISLSNLKDKITNYKNQVTILNQDIDWLMKTFEHTRSYIERTLEQLKDKCKDLTQEIQKSIVYISRIILVQPFLSIPVYIINIKYQDQIFWILSKVKKYLNNVKLYIDLYIRSLIGLINYVSLNIFMLKILLNKTMLIIDIMDKSVLNVECATEGVPRNFIRCSTKQVSTGLINHHNLGVVDIDDPVLSMYSVSGVMDYKVVVNRLFESTKKIHKIFDFIYSTHGCFCIRSFQDKNNINSSTGDVEIKRYVFRDLSGDEIYKMKSIEEIKRLYRINIDGNHLCLCMIIKYLLYPQVLNMVYVLSYELDALSTISRKYEKYAQPSSIQTQVIQMIIILIKLLHELCKFIESRYESHFVVSRAPVYLRCYCTYNDDPNYSSALSIILFLSSLMENIWSMDNHDIRIPIECLSSLLSELVINAKDNNIGWNKCKPYIYQIVINKYCCKKTDPPCDPKCCCVTCLIIILMSVYLHFC